MKTKIKVNQTKKVNTVTLSYVLPVYVWLQSAGVIDTKLCPQAVARQLIVFHFGMNNTALFQKRKPALCLLMKTDDCALHLAF